MSKLEILPYEWIFNKAFSTSSHHFSCRSGYYLYFEKNHLKAVAECAPLPGFSPESLDEAYAQLIYIQNEFDDRFEQEKPNFYTWLHSLQLFPSVEFSISVLFEDFHAQKHDLPFLNDYLEKDEATIHINALCSLGSIQETTYKIDAFISQGFQTIKLKSSSEQFEEQIQLLKKIQSKYSKSIQFRLDPNGQWSGKECIKFCQLIHESQVAIEYIEQPVWPIEANQMKILQDRSNVPLAADEMLSNPTLASELIEKKAVQALILKAPLIGSIQRNRNLIQRATENGLKIVVTTLLDSALNRIIHAKLAQVSNEYSMNFNTAHGLSTGSLLRNDLFNLALSEQGTQIINKPILGGLKSLFDENRLARGFH